MRHKLRDRAQYTVYLIAGNQLKRAVNQPFHPPLRYASPSKCIVSSARCNDTPRPLPPPPPPLLGPVKVTHSRAPVPDMPQRTIHELTKRGRAGRRSELPLTSPGARRSRPTDAGSDRDEPMDVGTAAAAAGAGGDTVLAGSGG